MSIFAIQFTGLVVVLVTVGVPMGVVSFYTRYPKES